MKVTEMCVSLSRRVCLENAFAPVSQRDARTHAGMPSVDAGSCRAAVVDTCTQTHMLSCTKLTMQQCGIELLCNGRERQNREGKLQVSGWSRVLLCRPPAVCVCLSLHMRFKLVEWCRGIYLNNNQRERKSQGDLTGRAGQ